MLFLIFSAGLAVQRRRYLEQKGHVILQVSACFSVGSCVSVELYAREISILLCNRKLYLVSLLVSNHTNTHARSRARTYAHTHTYTF